MKSWIHQISEKYIEQKNCTRKDLHEDYIKLNENEKFNLLISNIISYLQEQLETICGIDSVSLNETEFNSILNTIIENNTIVVGGPATGGTGGTGGRGGKGGKGGKARLSITQQEKILNAKKARAARDKAKLEAETPEERETRLKTRREKAAARKAARAAAKGGDGGTGGSGGQGGTGGHAQSNTQMSGSIQQGGPNSVFNNVTNNYGGNGKDGSEKGPKKIYRVERKLKNVIGPITKAIGVARGVGSGLDTMMGGSDGVLKGAETIGTSLTPNTLQQRQSAAIFGLNKRNRKTAKGLNIAER